MWEMNTWFGDKRSFRHTIPDRWATTPTQRPTAQRLKNSQEMYGVLVALDVSKVLGQRDLPAKEGWSRVWAMSFTKKFKEIYSNERSYSYHKKKELQ